MKAHKYWNTALITMIGIYTGYKKLKSVTNTLLLVLLGMHIQVYFA